MHSPVSKKQIIGSGHECHGSYYVDSEFQSESASQSSVSTKDGITWHGHLGDRPIRSMKSRYTVIDIRNDKKKIESEVYQLS